jgi:hypothetical protein
VHTIPFGVIASHPSGSGGEYALAETRFGARNQVNSLAEDLALRIRVLPPVRYSEQPLGIVLGSYESIP